MKHLYMMLKLFLGVPFAKPQAGLSAPMPGLQPGDFRYCPSRDRMLASIISCLMILMMSACEEKMTEEEILKIGITQQKTTAPFIAKLGFDVKRAVFSSSVTNKRSNAGSTPSERKRQRQKISTCKLG